MAIIDGTTLVVAESHADRLTAWTMADDGALVERRVWADLGPGAAPDGTTLYIVANHWGADGAGEASSSLNRSTSPTPDAPERPAPNWVAVVDSSFEVSLDGRPIPVSLSDLAATMTAMCMMCEGATREQVVDQHAKSVERHGWSVVAVDGTQWTPGWCYTIGLTETFGHPELAVVMCDDRQARRSLTRMVGRVAAGERLVSGYQELSGIGAVACREVAPEQLAGGLIALWPDVADRLAWSMVVPDVLQVDLPFLLCARHKRTDWDLSLDAPVFTEVCRPGEFGFRSGSTRGGARRRSASARGRRGSGDPRNRPSRWAS